MGDDKLRVIAAELLNARIVECQLLRTEPLALAALGGIPHILR
jgi:hypothetical protein